jgi:quercetin dioxygenase-like cupin family protein
VVLGRSSIDGLAWRPLSDLGDARAKVLLKTSDCVAGLLRLEPGTSEKVHVHADAHHHGWVLHGEARVAGIPIRAGSYFHIPAGASHAITEVGPAGCEVFYVYQPAR